jgi:hexokinase
MHTLLRLTRRGVLGTAAGAFGAAAAAVTAPLYSSCEELSSKVVYIEVPQDQWIEVKQKELADSFIDWTDVDMAYVEALRTVRGAYEFPVAKMRSLQSYFLTEAKLGLAGLPSSMRMLPTYVTKRVTGAEKGDFFALDLGGTNFRVLKLTLEGGGVVGPVEALKFKIPAAIKQGSGDELFGFLADSVATFIATKCSGNPTGTMGFTFSFPTVQTAINAGTLIVWNKDFSASGVVGADVVAQLQQKLKERGMSLEVAALANDTVGTMEAAAYTHKDTAMGVILGTGTNAAYVEKTSNVLKWDGPPSDEMVINTEWGNLDMADYMTLYDAVVDLGTANPGLQRFEKMISGLYLGEMTRVTTISPEVIQGFSPSFAAGFTKTFGERMSFQSALMSDIEADTSSDLSATSKALEAAGLPISTVRDRVLLREVCVNVSTRAAKLSATAVVALLEQANVLDGCTVAVDGTVFECYPFFKERMEGTIIQLIGAERAERVKLVLAKDGSGVGAAIIAAIAK